MKRTFIRCISLALCLTMGLTAFAAAKKDVSANAEAKLVYTYDDIEGHDYAEDIVHISDLGLIGSYRYANERIFGPDRALDRGTLILAAARLAATDLSAYTYTAYQDLLPGNPYLSAAEWARNNQLINHPGNLFGPQLPITREELAVILYNLTPFLGGKLPKANEIEPYEDATEITLPNRRAARIMQTAGIMAPSKDGKFNPAHVVSRGEACQILRNYIDAIASVNTPESR